MESSQHQQDTDLQARQEELVPVLKDYPGYGDTESRRISDESLRAHLLWTLSDFLLQIGSLKAFLVQRGDDLAGAVAGIEQTIEMTHDRLQAAPYAFSILFTADSVLEDIQLQVVGSDRELVDVASRIRQALEPTLTDDADFAALARDLGDVVSSLTAAIDRRFETIMEFQG